MITGDDLKKRFAYHPPKDHTVARRHEDIRAAAHAFATLILTLTPESREQSLAVTACEEAMMWANAAIARNQP